jgi:hypothetical protein
MVKKSFVFVISIVFLVFLISNISANIQISSLKQIYSLGDSMEFTVTLGDNTDDYLEINLVCSGEEKTIYYDVPDAKTSAITRKLIESYIGDLSGDCYLSAIYGADTGKSDNFKISNRIIVNFEADKSSYTAGEIISIKGTVIRENGVAPESAFVEASYNGISSSDIVTNGIFNLKLSTSQTMHAGRYPLVVKVYDKDDKRNIMNSGETSQDKSLNQKPQKIEIAISNQNIAPSENLSYIVTVYDFASDPMQEEVTISIHDSMNNSVYSESLIVNKNLIFSLPKTFAAGEATITAQKENVIGSKSFYVLEFKKISSQIKNETLVITNDGNVNYNEEISILIGNETIKKQISLAVGESKSFELSAPEGQYAVDVKDNSGEVYSGSVFLTGKVIDAKEIKASINLFFRYPFVWIFILFIVFFAIILTYKNSPSHASYTYPSEVRIKKPGKIMLNSKVLRMQPKSNELNLVSGKIKKAEQVLVTTGHKQESTLVYFKIKNKISKEAEQNLVKILETASKFNGIPYRDGYSYGLIFSPVVTKSFKNEKDAVNAAMAIDSELKEANRKFKDKIEYGIGINSGEVISNVEGVVLQFTNIGKTIPLVKKIAEISNQEVLISENVHRKTEEVKVEKASPDKGDIIYFRIKRVIDSEYHKKFIEGFLRRNN